MKRLLALLLALLTLCLCAPALAAKSTPEPVATPVPATDEEVYAQAARYLDAGFALEAVNAYAQLGDYQDAPQWYVYARALLLWQRQDAAEALSLLDSLGAFADAPAQAARMRRLAVHRWWDAGLFGYVDLAGNVVIPAGWDYAPRTFAEASARDGGELCYAAVYRGALTLGETDAQPDPNGIGAWGVLRSDGVESLPCEYAAIAWVQNGYAAVQNATGWRLYDLEAGAFIGDTYAALGTLGEGSVPAQSGELWVYLSLADGSALGEGFVYSACLPVTEGYGACVRDGVAGFIDATGAMALTGEYMDARSFSGGLAAVRSTRKRWGYINTSGELVIPCKYRDAGAFVSGVCPVKDGDKWGVIDAQGEVVLRARYDEIAHIDALTNRLWMRNNKLWGIASLTGEVVIKPAYSTTTGFSADRMAGVSYRGAYGYIDVRGTAFIPLEHKAGTAFAAGLGAVGDGGGTVDYRGKFNSAFALYSDIPVAAERGFIESRIVQSREDATQDADGDPVRTLVQWMEYRLYNTSGELAK